MESTRKLSNFNSQGTKTLYQNNLNNIVFCFTFFKGYKLLNFLMDSVLVSYFLSSRTFTEFSKYNVSLPQDFPTLMFGSGKCISVTLPNVFNSNGEPQELGLGPYMCVE